MSLVKQEAHALDEIAIRAEFSRHGKIDVFGSIGDKATISFVQGDEKVRLVSFL